ncbi:Conidial yellow pigment biosynthesis polyketide synthase [Cytospora mali]|uniref:Conidial yellow pigment biosynthesis polyketide synthase n=1 Tax=Cytospora mali TaxID=578113 RepID=A0A194W1K0_CYTMA|nr:Conidial yellow pigment biosynthesis polyketide synthase [Valsa mali]
MTSSNSSVSREALLVVGPKRSRFTPKDLSELHSTITSNSDLNFLPEAIAELESLWPTIVAAHSRLKNVHGEQSLHNLGQFLKSGELADLTQTGGRHDNILLDVVTVLSHIVDFWCLTTTKIQNALFTHLKSDKSSHRLHSIQGFCLGFLTAAAVSSARTKAELATNITTVLRIAVCIGALVESDVMELEKSGTQAASLSVGWSSQSDYEALNNVLSMYPSGYIACMTDVTRATVTILERDANPIKEQISSLGLSIQSLPLQGRYHCHSTYEDGVLSLKALFQRDARFQLPSAASLILPLRSNVDGSILTEGPLHEVALESILLHQCQWYETLHHAAGLSGIQAEDILQVGTETTVPRSLHHALSTPSSPNDASAVAVIGMACRYPDADSLEEFWELLRDGNSAVRALPAERFHVSEVTREPKDGAFWGNFLRYPGYFDHRFFGISGREAKYMDPQQRLALQVTYEVLESAGYFGVGASPEKFPADIGCYLGVGSVDYGDNVASHDATALSALGTLRAFISGRAIRSGECSLALAGGVNVITSPALFQNLAAASFLSPTGASKAFDASANGYCRGEGAGLVLLKSLARARADQDSILAVITGSAVNQGANCSPITVPVSDSQSVLYKKALSISGTDPKHVSFVEAHGTGTPVGDPIECESIRRTFGGSDRKYELFLGSVKDSIGHTEASSGAAALIKTILMMQKRAIPKQAGFTRLNPKIPPLEPDRITVPRQTQRWTAPRRIAVVNNYGAAGSNAAIVVQDLDRMNTVPVVNGHGPTLTASELPFFLSAKTPESLREYCKVLKANLPQIQEGHGDTATLNLAYNLSVKQNRGFEYNYSFTASTLEEVISNLYQVQIQTVEFKKTITTRRPVVLCIGGQTGRTVHLDEGLFRNSKILQKHLDACEQICHTLGLPSLYPTIFSPEPVQDLVSLHSLLFSLQYASARAWLDSGLKVDTIIGHSFGQLTALVVTSALSLEDGLRYITARARLIQELWGHETGEMLSVKGDSSMVNQLIERTKSQYPALAAEIGCYNGPQAVVLAGDRASIDALEDMVNVEDFSRHLKAVRLKNTHAFHSSLVDGILPGLREIAATLEFRKPSIHIEACSKDQDWNQVIDLETIVQHSRGPVYFHDAVQRIEAKLGPCVFLEAGSASPIVPMARRALTKSNEASNETLFQSIDIGPPNSLDKLAKATSNLWAAGVNVQYWPFHQSQKDSFAWINMPPYQFQKNFHWIEYIAPKTAIPEPALAVIQDKTQQSLQLLELYERDLQGTTTFRINTVHEMFTCCARGHAVLGQSLCPASMYVEIAMRAANIIDASAVSPPAPCVKDLKISAPLSLSSIRSVFLQLVPVGMEPNSWEFTVLSRSQQDATASTKHATGTISFLLPGTYLDAPRMQFIRRLIGQNKYEELASARGAHILNGGIVYQVFGQVVDYAPYYRGVAQIVSKNKEAVGVVHVPGGQPPVMSEADCDPITLDNFLQVAGIHVNCLSERKIEEVFVCTEMGEMFIGDAYLAKRREMKSYKVYTSFDQRGIKTLVNDIFVFHPDTGDLMVVFLGAIFQGVPMKSLARTLAKLNSSAGATSIETQHDPVLPALQKSSNNSNFVPVVQTPLAQIRIATKTNGAVMTARTAQANSTDVLQQIRELFSRVIEIPIEEVKPSVSLSALGIDSLMSTEILNEIKAQFDIVIPVEQLLALDDVQSLSQLLGPVRNNAATPPIPHQDTIASITEPALSGGPNGLSTSFAQIQEFLSNLLDIPDNEIAADTSLDKLGIDSLMASEVLSEIKKRFDVTILAEEFQEFQDVLAIATRLQASSGTFTPPLSLGDASTGPQINGHTNEVPEAVESESVTSSASVAYDSFSSTRREFDSICQDLKFADFYAKVYPAQMNLVVTYIAEAFQDMGCSLAALQSGEKVLDISVLRKHHKVKRRIYEILEDADIIKQDAAGAFVRTTTPVPTGISSQLHRDIVANFPQHAFEHNLLASTGPKLADCLTGKADPLAIIFGSAAARTLMENVYTHAPMFKAGTVNLARYLVNFSSRFPSSRPIRILELGAGTGGTTKHLLESLLATGRDFEYTFTDISSSLVAAARKKFAQHDFMRYALLNIEQPPASQFCGQYDIVLSTNCIHATKDLTRSCTNIRACLRPDGVLCLVELTRNLFWFDLVFGLLEGWWLFEDGRQHALASETLWRKHLLRSGFRWIDWTVGASEESNVLRVITASPADIAQSEPKTIIEPVTMETVAFKRVDNLTLNADVYYPKEQRNGVQVRPVALMIHGGGHVMLSRKDIRPPQTQTLLAAGFLPISIDYRLCPETTLPSGPMADARDALAWVRSVLPKLPLRRPDIRADGNRVVAVGWSTGGHLALTLGFTAPAHGIRPPDATLVFYCPSDYEDPFWTRPNRPFGQGKAEEFDYDLLEGVRDRPIAAYNPPADRRALGGWMSTADPRSRIALHMNWTGRYLRILLNGLSPAGKDNCQHSAASDPTDSILDPSREQIQAVSPLAHIRQGKYRVPTFIVHGTKDDLIPWQQAVRTYDALREQGVPAEIRILDGAVHLFDLYKSYESDASAKKAVSEGYEMLTRYVA